MSYFSPVKLPPELKKQPDYDTSWRWEQPLNDCRIPDDSELQLTDNFVPVRAFAHDILRHHIKHFKPTLRFVIDDGPSTSGETSASSSAIETICWVGVVRKIAGYRALVRWAGCREGTIDAWINVGSLAISPLPTVEMLSSYPNFHCPAAVRAVDPTTSKSPFELDVFKADMDFRTTRTLNRRYRIARKANYKGCRLKVGQRLELLDNFHWFQVRPARVVAVAGTRVCVRVSEEDCEGRTDNNYKQFGPDAQFWVDQSSFYLFHVGWAARNGYRLDAKQEYVEHAHNVARSIEKGELNAYDDSDVTMQQMKKCRKTLANSSVGWLKGYKFEMLHPLGLSLAELKVASVVEVLKDGYIVVCEDVLDAKEHSFPIHVTSGLLFPVGYAANHGLKLIPPEGIKDFTWPEYLDRSKSVAAPDHLFKSMPKGRRMDLFKVGARLEVSDAIENRMISPATIASIHGRLVKVHYDGWDSTYDQLYDIDSMDIFPIGWCELHGFRLEPPKIFGPPAKKKRKTTHK